MNIVKKGDLVSVYFTARSKDGNVRDATKHGRPVQFPAGGDDIIPGLSTGVIGMRLGESKRLTLLPKDTYGEHDPESIFEIPLADLPPNTKIGDKLYVDDENGAHTFEVLDIDHKGMAIIDGNHPLSGQILTFDLKVVNIT